MNDSALNFPIRDLRFEDVKELSDRDAVRQIMQIRADLVSKLESGELEATPERLAVLERAEKIIAEEMGVLV